MRILMAVALIVTLSSAQLIAVPTKKVIMNVSFDRIPQDPIEIVLFGDDVPKTAENFF